VTNVRDVDSFLEQAIAQGLELLPVIVISPDGSTQYDVTGVQTVSIGGQQYVYMLTEDHTDSSDPTQAQQPNTSEQQVQPE